MARFDTDCADYRVRAISRQSRCRADSTGVWSHRIVAPFLFTLAVPILPSIVTYVALAALGCAWGINGYRCKTNTGTFNGSSAGALYYNVVRLLSVVSFVLMAPLWGQSATAPRYGKWVLMTANAISIGLIAMVVILAEPYWEAWGCYGSGHVSRAFVYQEYGLCVGAILDGIPITEKTTGVCKVLGGVDKSGTAHTNVCSMRDGDVLTPFRHLIKWCLHLLAVTYAGYVVLTLRKQTAGSLPALVTQLATKFRDNIL